MKMDPDADDADEAGGFLKDSPRPDWLCQPACRHEDVEHVVRIYMWFTARIFLDHWCSQRSNVKHKNVNASSAQVIASVTPINVGRCLK